MAAIRESYRCERPPSTGSGARTPACSVHTFQKPSTIALIPKGFVGQGGNLRPIVNRPALWGGQSWLQPAFLHLCTRRFLPQETFPKGSPPAPENATYYPVLTPRSENR